MKSLAAVLVILGVVVLTACDGNSNETTESDSEPAARARFVAIGWQDGTIALDRTDSALATICRLSPVRLTVDEDYAQPHSKWFRTVTTGTLTVDFTLTSPSKGPRSKGRVELEPGMIGDVKCSSI